MVFLCVSVATLASDRDRRPSKSSEDDGGCEDVVLDVVRYADVLAAEPG